MVLGLQKFRILIGTSLTKHICVCRVHASVSCWLLGSSRLCSAMGLLSVKASSMLCTSVWWCHHSTLTLLPVSKSSRVKLPLISNGDICTFNTDTHTRLTALCPGLPGWAGTRNVKPIWILLKQETVSGSGICWAVCKSAPHSRQITTPAPHRSVFYRPDALPAAQPTASKQWGEMIELYTETNID